MSANYGTPRWRRPVLAPGILGAVVLVAGFALIGADGFTVIRYATSILALVCAWIAVQNRSWWTIAPLVPMALLWNPVVPVDLPDAGWLIAHYVGAALFILVAVLVRVPADSRR